MRSPIAITFSFVLIASAFWPIEALEAAGTSSMYQQTIASLQSTGIIDAGPIDSLRLSDGINRAEALKVILRSQAKYASSLPSIIAAMPPLPLFPDIDQKSWYAPYVELGFRSRLITGYPDGTFQPQGGVKTGDAAAMIVRAFGDDRRSGTVVMPGSHLQPEQVLTRGQLFDMVARMRAVHGYPLTSWPKTVQSPMTGSSGTTQAVQDGAALPYVSTKPFAISIPTIGLTDLTITHPKDPFTQEGVLAPLQEGVGHLISYPGEGSKVMIYGHSSGYPWDLSQYTKIFRSINTVAVGAHVYVTYKGKLHVYKVTAKKTVSAKDSSYLEPDDKGEQLILYTCWPPDSITNRFLVIAEPVETRSPLMREIPNSKN